MMWDSQIKDFPASPSHARDSLTRLKQLETFTTKCEFSRFDDIGLEDLDAFCDSMPEIEQSVREEFKTLKDKRSIITECYDYADPKSDYRIFLAQILPDGENFANIIVHIKSNFPWQAQTPPRQSGIKNKVSSWLDKLWKGDVTRGNTSQGDGCTPTESTTQTGSFAPTGSGNESGDAAASHVEESRIDLYNLYRYLALERLVKEGIIHDYQKAESLEHLRRL